MPDIVILDALRTPFGKRGGALRQHRPDALLARVLDAAVARSGVAPEAIGDVITGCVSQAGEQGANIGRLAVMLSDLPQTVPAVSLNRMCGSSQQAVAFAANTIAGGDARYAIACGVESMSRVPMFLDISLGRDTHQGFDGLNPALWDRYEIIHQVESAERIAAKWQIGRAELDEYARLSHARALAARDQGLNREIVEIEGVDREGSSMILRADEGIREVWDGARTAAMAPVFRKPDEGVVTAANASQISDGASAVVLADAAAARADGLEPRGGIVAKAVVGSDPTMQLTGVIPATRAVLDRAGMALSDMDWIEVNEAFASVVLSWARDWQPDMDKVNPWGGAIAHGHPLGATGAGLMAKMLTGLEATDGEFGLQLMCIGHGMATATIIQRL